jgi:hypothetical protein
MQGIFDAGYLLAELQMLSLAKDTLSFRQFWNKHLKRKDDDDDPQSDGSGMSTTGSGGGRLYPRPASSQRKNPNQMYHLRCGIYRG